MRTYVLRRILINIPVIWLVVTLVFLATSVLPGDFVVQRIAASDPTNTDPRAKEEQIRAIRAELGLNDSVGIRYVKYLGDLARGDLGQSFTTKRSSVSSLKEGLPYTIQLSVMSLIIGFATAIPIGIISAIRQDSPVDYVLRILAIVSLAAPPFWVATMFALYVTRWNWFDIPVSAQPLFWDDPVESLKLFAIPALVGGLASGAGIMRLLRSQMLEVLRQDYIRTAWAKGVRERVVIGRHALKNALVPVVTVMGLTIAGLLSGNVVLENIFGIPGIGRRILFAISARDVPVIQAFVIVIATFVVFVNLAVDLLYGVLDPRIRYGR